MTVFSKMAKNDVRQKQKAGKKKQKKSQNYSPNGLCSICKDVARVQYDQCGNCGETPSDHHTGCCKERSERTTTLVVSTESKNEESKQSSVDQTTHQKWMMRRTKWVEVPEPDRFLYAMGRCWSTAAQAHKDYSRRKMAYMRCQQINKSDYNIAQVDEMERHLSLTDRKDNNIRKAEWDKLRAQYRDATISGPERQTALSNSTPESEAVSDAGKNSAAGKKLKTTKFKLGNKIWSKHEQQMRTIIDTVIQTVMNAIDIRVEAEDTVYGIIEEAVAISEETKVLKRLAREARDASTAEFKRAKLFLDYWLDYMIPITNAITGQTQRVSMHPNKATLKATGYDTYYVQVGTQKHLYASLRSELPDLPRSASIRIWYSDYTGSQITVESDSKTVDSLIDKKLFYYLKRSPRTEIAEEKTGNEYRIVERTRIL